MTLRCGASIGRTGGDARQELLLGRSVPLRHETPAGTPGDPLERAAGPGPERFPAAYREAPAYLMLGNLDPGVQAGCWTRWPDRPRWWMDTMNFWMECPGGVAQSDERVDILAINDAEGTAAEQERTWRKRPPRCRRWARGIWSVRRGNMAPLLFSGDRALRPPCRWRTSWTPRVPGHLRQRPDRPTWPAPRPQLRTSGGPSSWAAPWPAFCCERFGDRTATGTGPGQHRCARIREFVDLVDFDIQVVDQ